MDPKRRYAPALEGIRRWMSIVLLLCSTSSAMGQTPITLFQSFTGRVNHTATGGSLRTQPNTTNACSITGSSANPLTGVPATATVLAAHLYWAGSGSTVDNTVTLNGNTVTANRTFTARFTLGATNFDFFSGYADVTPIVAGNGTYTFSGLTVNNGAPYCGSQAVLAGWALVVVYQDPNENLRAVNIFDGFEFFRGSSFTSTLTGFRTPPTGINGQVTHVTWEGDPQNSGSLSGFSESLTFNGGLLDDGLVPPGSSPTVQQFDGTVNVLGSITEYGVDVDTYDVSALLSPGDTSATATYSSGADLVLLSVEVLSATTEPVVDLTMSKTHTGNFSVGNNGDYTLRVGNNGPETDAIGVTVTDTLPTGLSYVGFAGTDWSCGVSGQDVTCTHPGPLPAGQFLPDLTLTVLPDAAATPSVDNTATVSSPSFDSDTSNNSATDTTLVDSSDLSTSTKGVVDTDGGDADPGDTLRYTITLTETGGTDATGVSLLDDIPANISSFSVQSIPAGATDSSTGPGTGANGNGLVSINDITVPANSSVTVVFDVVIAGTAVPGDVIPNQAQVTNPFGVGATPSAPNVIVSQSQITGGTKTLYFYGLGSPDPNGFNEGPGPYLSRTPPGGGQGNVTVDRNQPPRTWNLTPATRGPLTLEGPTIPVTLILSKGGSGGGSPTRTLQIALSTTGAVTGPLGTPVTLTFAAPPSSSPTTLVFNIPLAGTVNLPTGTQILATATNTTPGGGSRRIRVFPTQGGNFSRVDMNAQTVIRVDSVTTFDGAFPGGSAQSNFAPGQTVFVRATVSDPFGSFDISSASLDLLDALGTGQLTNAPMNLVADDNLASRTYELSYAIPGGAALGAWTPRVTAVEGTEGLITHTLSGNFVVAGPNLLVLKTVVTQSDPVNGTTNPKAIPGATMMYTVEVTNQGQGPVDSDALTVTDAVPADTALFVDTSGGDPIVFTDGPVPSGLTFDYGTQISFSNQPGGGAPYTYVPTPDAQGFDAAVTGFRFLPQGALAGAAGGSNPSFQLQFRVRID